MKKYCIGILITVWTLVASNARGQLGGGTLDYANYEISDTLGYHRIYKGYGGTFFGGYALLDALLFEESRFYITDVFYGSAGVNIGKSISESPTGEKAEGFSGAVALGLNLSLAAGYRDDRLGFGASYTFLGGTYITDLADEWVVRNRGLLSASFKYDIFMAQVGFPTITKYKDIQYKTWYAQFNVFLQDDDLPMYLLARFENSKSIYAATTSKVVHFSLGIGFLGTTTGVRSVE